MANAKTPMFTGALWFLSNFDETPFDVPALDRRVASGEHAFNALKTLDPVERVHVLNQATPAQAKHVGRRVTLRGGWETGGRVRAMQQVLVAKFAVADLASRLEATGGVELVETNFWHDQFWGSCFCASHNRTPGRNTLGELLMAIRDSCR